MHHLRRESLRTTLWFVPTLLLVAAVGLFAATYPLDVAAFHHHLSLPSWVRQGSPDAGRQVLAAIAAAVITVVGVVFSITIVALTLASQQFGPRMLRSFIRDRGTQVTLGAFVATFVYAVLALAGIGAGPPGGFVPNLCITVSLAALLADLGVLIYFIHHIATSIQLPEVIAGIARDLQLAIDRLPTQEAPASEEHLATDQAGAAIEAPASGYLRYVACRDLVQAAAGRGAVVVLAHRPGQFVVAGTLLATVWPAGAGAALAPALAAAHRTGTQRSLVQDPVFAIDQLVEIAIRALSPAVNDTFTALTCIDWLCDGLCRLGRRPLPGRVHRDDLGEIRVIEPGTSYERMVNRAFDKVRHAGRGMPAVALRLAGALATIADVTTGHGTCLARQAAMVLRSAEESIPDPGDLAPIRARCAAVLTRLPGAYQPENAA